MAVTTRPVMKDLSQRDSITNPSFVDRVDYQIDLQKHTEELAHAQAVKSGRINDLKVRGVSEYETDWMRRVAAATERPENSSAYRTQERINEHLKWVSKNLKEDAARERAYQKELQNYLS